MGCTSVTSLSNRVLISVDQPVLPRGSYRRDRSVVEQNGGEMHILSGLGGAGVVEIRGVSLVTRWRGYSRVNMSVHPALLFVLLK
jgi:hypothetical protein